MIDINLYDGIIIVMLLASSAVVVVGIISACRELYSQFRGR
jgi:hypothetical protein